ncbi:unnamed protein product [Anisakis simplex]|uniref:Uncharacterized protein n=1 Tax=Anisakis simplex TaxID=6269 RepID=A0A0M3JF50_ANISI|nr:unnamed protein product [Anisakis simplex]
MMQRRCSLIVNNCKRIRSNLPLISSNRCYDRGSGVRRAEDVQKEIVKRNEDKKEENPFEYTIFGGFILILLH